MTVVVDETDPDRPRVNTLGSVPLAKIGLCPKHSEYGVWVPWVREPVQVCAPGIFVHERPLRKRSVNPEQQVEKVQDDVLVTHVGQQPTAVSPASIRDCGVHSE